MPSLRALIRDHHRLALAFLLLAMCIKATIPVGLMLSASADRVLTVTICADNSAAAKQMQMVIPGKPQSSSAKQSGHCAFAGLGSLALGGADAILLAIAFAVILVLGMAPTRLLPFRSAGQLRPPLRGPPLAA